MKTAISIPDELYAAAEAAARKLGLSRSRFFARAVEAYLERQGAREVTERLNEIYADAPSSVDPLLTGLQYGSLRKEEW